MKNRFTFIIGALYLISIFALPADSLAQDGSLDLTFGTNGFVTTPVGVTHEGGNSVVIQSDGKIIAAGSTKNGTVYNFALVRYNTDGSVDTSFDTDGKVTTLIGTSSSITSAALQSDGKIVVVGSSSNGFYNDFALARYNTNGTLDTTFDTDGTITLDIGTTDDDAFSVAIQSDNKIVVAGRSFSGAMSYFSLVRYNTNGVLDTTFDVDGIVTTDFGNTMNWGYAVAIQNDGKIVVAGMSGEILGSHYALARYNANGSLDSTFDNDGKVTTEVSVEYDGAYDVAIQNNGKIVAAGYSEINADDDFAVVRYNSDGSLDTTFDADGIIVTAFSSFADTPNSVVIQSDGKIVTGGYSVVGGAHYYFALARYNTNGTLDTTFDADGKVTTLFGPDSDTGYDIALQSDGKIVMVGSSSDCACVSAQTDFAMVRYNNTIATGINIIDNQFSQINIYPNPFSTSTTISFSLSQSENISLRVVDLDDRLIKTLADGKMAKNEYSFEWDISGVEAGIYFLQLQSGEMLQMKKIIITR